MTKSSTQFQLPRPEECVGQFSLRREVMKKLLPQLRLGLFLLTPLVAPAQSLIITNGVQTYPALTNTIVTLSNRCELRITAATTPISNCLIHLNSADSFFVLANIKPSAVVASYLSQVRINGAVAVADNNCRVVQHGMGTVVIPQAAGFQPLQVFSGPHFNGTAAALNQSIYYKGAGLGALNATISSFKLKRGYMATFAQNESGSGISKCYVAQDGDLEISVLPADFDNSVRFVYVLPWRWAGKKGIAGNIESGLNVQWKYNWNIDQNSTRDLEYVPIRQTRWWPGLDQNWQTRGANQLLGYNEPDSPDQANIAVGDAIWSWPDLLGTGLRLGSPAPTDGGRSSWLYPFLTQADAANLRVDFVAVHYYWCFNPADPNGAATQMYNFLKATYDEVKRPLWITEWNNGANWTGCGDPTSTQQQAAIAAILDMLDNTPFVERYALYNWVEDVRRLKWDDGSLTPAGVTYRDKLSPLAYQQALPDNGTRSFTQLRFDTNALDTSGYGNNGITTGSPAYTNGNSGQALVFDGANTVVTLPPNVAKNNAFTFAAWLNWDGGGNWQRIFDFGNSTTHYMFLSPSSGSGTLRFAIRNGGGEQIVETSGLAPNQWRHIAVTLSGNTARIYVNGALAAANTGTSITPASFSPRVNFLGKSQFSADPLFKGLMDEVLITDYALSAAQIAGLQTNTPPQFTNSIFARGSGTEGMAFNDTIAGTATDSDPGDPLTYSKAVGPAWLNVAADGSLTGTPTSGDGGTNFFTVRVTDAAGQNAFALVTISVTTLTASGTWIADANGLWGEPIRWSGSAVAAGAGQTANFSTINITGNRTVTLESSRGIGTLRFGDTIGAQTWTITNSVGSVLTLDTGSATSPAIVVTNTATLATSLAGPNGFTKSGPGTLILAGNNSLNGTINIDTANTTFAEGAVRVAHPSALAGATLIQIRNNNSGSSTLQLDGTAGGIEVPAHVAVNCRNLAVPTIQNLAGTNTLSGNIRLDVGGSMFNIQSDAGLLVFNGTNQYVGGLAGGRSYIFKGPGSHLVNGPILNSTNGAPISLIKSNIGSLTLAGINTYTSTTTVNGGALYVNGTIGAGGLILTSGTTLGGHGVIYSAVTVPAGGTLAPGTSIGQLTVSNNVILQAGSTTRMEINQAATTNDQLRVSGALTYAGTLVVTNLAGTLGAGDSFQLFNAASYNGAFTTTNLPALNPGLQWQWTPANGMLSIITTVALNPTNITANLSDNTLQLSWPADHLGWRLETNAVSLVASNAWFPLAGSAATNQMFLPVDPTSSNVFFRLVSP
jgi:autotransporter-associated beta strand protein